MRQNAFVGRAPRPDRLGALERSFRFPIAAMGVPNCLYNTSKVPMPYSVSENLDA